MDQLREIVDITSNCIIAVRRPLAVAMAAQIRRQNMPVVPECVGDPVPVATVVTPAVDEKKWRPAGITPIDVVQPQSLRKKIREVGPELSSIMQ